MLLVAGCGDTPDGSATTTPPRSPAPSATSSSPTEGPEASSAGSASTEPSAEPTESEAPSSTAGSGPAAACAGSDDNRDFYASVAGAVDWAVYCPVLPSRWFVAKGDYSLAGGGRMTIAYNGPGGASIELVEGVVCGDDACSPSGTDLGEAAFGDMDGTLWDVGSEGLELLVDPTSTPSWILRTTGVSESDARAIGADLVRVDS